MTKHVIPQAFTSAPGYISRKCKVCGIRTHRNTADDYLGNMVLPCRGTCGRLLYAAPVLGRISTKHVCGAKCLSAFGPSCECSCGGKNHGAGHVNTTESSRWPDLEAHDINA